MVSLLTRLRALRLPPAARAVLMADARGLPAHDPGIDACIEAALDWLCRAQDMTASHDDGVARDYSLLRGWATSYPETTGYIIPTFLTVSRLLSRPDLEARARRMLDWCLAIQLADGGFQGGRIDAEPVVPVTFNTGQILLGLAAGASRDPEYMVAMMRAAQFLRDSLDSDGCWRSHPTPFASSGEKAYETHVSWALFAADRVAPGNGLGDAGMRQVSWAISKQMPNGWVKDCCLNRPDTPLTHTLGYYLKGLIEAHRWSRDEAVLAAALRTARGLVSAQRDDGALPGRLAADWSATVRWSCLTGNVQVADSWFYLGEITGDERLVRAARAANAFTRRTIRIDGPVDQRGGLKGAFPVDGDYGAFEYLNWAAKFLVDSCLAEKGLG